MLRAGRFACALALAFLALSGVAPAAAAQEGDTAAPQSVGPRTRAGEGEGDRIGTRIDSRIERRRARRDAILRDAPPGFSAWTEEMQPARRRMLERRLQLMPPLRRREFYRRWEAMSPTERRDLEDRLSLRVERREARELPPRLRTPELRETLREMSPEERQRFFARVQEWRDMSPRERTRMRERLEKFGALSESEQRALIDARFQTRSPEAREKMLRDLREASEQLRARRVRRGGSAPDAAPTPAPE
jgi:hypothetical protein